MADTMMDARKRLDDAKRELEEAKKRHKKEEGNVLRRVLAEIREQFPKIERLGFQAHWEYDDEGSYLWYVSPRLEPHEDSDVWSRYEKSYKTYNGETRTYQVTEYYDITEGLLDGFSPDAWAAAVGVDALDDGETYWVGEEND